MRKKITILLCSRGYTWIWITTFFELLSNQLFVYYIFDFFVPLYHLNPKWNILLYTGKSPYVFVIEKLHWLCRHQFYILLFLLTEKSCSSLSFSPVAANSHPKAQEGAPLDEPLRRSDRTGSGREGRLLPRLQSSSSRHPSGERRPVEPNVEDLTFEAWSSVLHNPHPFPNKNLFLLRGSDEKVMEWLWMALLSISSESLILAIITSLPEED